MFVFNSCNFGGSNSNRDVYVTSDGITLILNSDGSASYNKVSGTWTEGEDNALGDNTHVSGFILIKLDNGRHYAIYKDMLYDNVSTWWQLYDRMIYTDSKGIPLTRK